LSTAAQLSQSKAVDLHLSTIKHGRKNKRILLFSTTPSLKSAQQKQTFLLLLLLPLLLQLLLFSTCLVNRCEAVAKPNCRFTTLANQRWQEKRQNFIILVNSKAKIRKTKTNFSSSSFSSSAASPIALSIAVKL
jgi:hypothetical protein